MYDIVDDLSVLCGMVIKRKKDVKNTSDIDYIGYNISNGEGGFRLCMKQDKCTKLCNEIRDMCSNTDLQNFAMYEKLLGKI